MSADARPAGLDAFALCPSPGCPVRVYGPVGRQTPCRAHSGPETPQYPEEDCWGDPITDTAAVGALHPAARHSPEA